MTEKITHEELGSLYHSCNVTRAMKLLTGPDWGNKKFAPVLAKQHRNRLRHCWGSNIKMDLVK
jgi:hypothetical protein